MLKSILSLPYKRIELNRGDEITDLIWPVYIVECCARQPKKKILNPLEMAVLNLLDVKVYSIKKISELLDVSEEVIKKIIADLEDQGYYDKAKKIVTEEGCKLMNGEETEDFSERSIFGNMFISRINGDIMPYFLEGNLPSLENIELDSNSIVLRCNHSIKPSRNLRAKLNKAYSQYIKMRNRMISDKQNEIKFCQSEISSPDLEDEYEENESILENYKIEDKLNIYELKSYFCEANLRFRICVSRSSPDSFKIIPPFNIKETTTYSKWFKNFRNIQEIQVEYKNEIIPLNDYCIARSNEFYIRFPELEKYLDPERVVQLEFPMLPAVSEKYISTIEKRLLETLNCLRLYENKHLPANNVVVDMGRFLELLLNYYIVETNIKRTVTNYESLIISYEDIEKRLFEKFSIFNCSALSLEKKNLDRKKFSYCGRYKGILSNFSSYYHRYGRSISEKYFYLLFNALLKDSPFRRVMMREGAGFIDCLDELAKIRNKKGAHQDTVEYSCITEKEMEEIKKKFFYIVKTLLKEL